MQTIPQVESRKSTYRKCGVVEISVGPPSFSSIFGSSHQTISHFNFTSLSNISRNTLRYLGQAAKNVLLVPVLTVLVLLATVMTAIVLI